MLTFESNVVFVMRYMVDAKIVGANWVTLPAGAYFFYFYFFSNVVFVMRYMVDAKMVGANWVTLPAGAHYFYF